jgi:hypothetical protein
LHARLPVHNACKKGNDELAKELARCNWWEDNSNAQVNRASKNGENGN